MPCSGGQSCWEHDVYFRVCEDGANDPESVAWLGDSLRAGTYDGYGCIVFNKDTKFQIVPIEFKEYYDDAVKVVFVSVWCKSCIDGREE